MTDNITLPKKRTTGETLEERLTENAYESILPARYLKSGEDGEPVEEVENIFERVAKNIAVAEAVHADGFVLIRENHIKPDHPRREEIMEEVFGRPVPSNEPLGVTDVLSEENARWVSYDRLMNDGEIDWNTKHTLQEWKQRFQKQMENLSFIPNTPTLINAGNEMQMLSACFVQSPSDDIRDIHEKAADAAEIFQGGGGMGYAFSHLRPYGDTVGSSGGIASGPISFMRTFDRVCSTIAQGGVRRGAQMGVMRITHPDVPYFIHAKNKVVSLARTLKLNDPDDYTYTSFGEALEEAQELIDEEGRVPKHLRNAVEGHLSNFNISVTITDEFMEAAKNGEEYDLINPRTGEPHIATEETKELWGWFDLDEYVTVGEELSVPAQEILNRVADGAHENGEPGVIFIDTVNDDHSFDVESTPTFQGGGQDDHQIYASNPCAEEMLEEGDACNLGHINLSTVVAEDAPSWRGMDFYEDDEGNIGKERTLESKASEYLAHAIDWDELDARIEAGTRFLDNVVTMSDFPIQKIDETVQNNRKIGLGIMGLAQMFIQLEVEYGSDVGNELARQVMTYINQESKTVSNQLAEERGVFPTWEESKFESPMDYPDWFERQTGENPEDWEDGYPLRNHNTTTIAPTGTTSMIGNTTGGCEPIYNVAYYKNVSDDVQGDEMLVEFDDYFLEVLQANQIDVQVVKDEAESQMAANEFDGIEGLSTVPNEIGELFVTTGDLTGKEHASVQCALQDGVDSGISKTCNFPNNASKEDVEEVIHYLYEHGAKGSTIYRDGTRSKQVLTTRADNKEFSSDEMTEDEAREVIEDLNEEFDFNLVTLSSVDPNVSTEDEDVWTEEDIEEFFGELHPQPTDEDATPAVSDNAEYATKRDRPSHLTGSTQRIETGFGSLYVTINEDQDGRAFELFTNTGNSGGMEAGFSEAISKCISIGLRSGVDPEELSKTLQGIQSPKVAWDDGQQITSIPDAIGVAMERWMDAHPDDAELAQAYQEHAQETEKNFQSAMEAAEEAKDTVEYVGSEPGDFKDMNSSADELFDNDYSEQERVYELLKEGLESANRYAETETENRDKEKDTETPDQTLSGEQCPDCDRYQVFRSEGCQKCRSCGWSEC